MSSGANDQVNFMQFSIFLDHDWGMLRYIRVDHMFFLSNSFNRPAMVLFQQLRN